MQKIRTTHAEFESNSSLLLENLVKSAPLPTSSDDTRLPYCRVTTSMAAHTQIGRLMGVQEFERKLGNRLAMQGGPKSMTGKIRAIADATSLKDALIQIRRKGAGELEDLEGPQICVSLVPSVLIEDPPGAFVLTVETSLIPREQGLKAYNDSHQARQSAAEVDGTQLEFENSPDTDMAFPDPQQAAQSGVSTLVVSGLLEDQTITPIAFQIEHPHQVGGSITRTFGGARGRADFKLEEHPHLQTGLSKTHFRITVKRLVSGLVFTLHDTDSTNGTFFNTNRLGSAALREASVQRGDSWEITYPRKHPVTGQMVRTALRFELN